MDMDGRNKDVYKNKNFYIIVVWSWDLVTATVIGIGLRIQW